MNELLPRPVPLLSSLSTTVIRSRFVDVGRPVIGVPSRYSSYLTRISSSSVKKLEWRRYGSCGLSGFRMDSCLACSVGSEEGGEWSWSCGENGVVWEADRIARVVDGELVRWGDSGSICTDSRKLERGEWFLALVGPNFDGHEFLPQALERGCAGVIGQDVDRDWARGFIRVECSLKALHRLAAYVRKGYRGPLVGITGSTGKTTAKAMTALALSSLGHIHQTVGNFNNHIGVPLTLLKLPSTASACVLEMGMSAAGEIQVLADIAEPSVRVVLNVGLAHMENFEKLEQVAEAKGELFSSAKPGDICILYADDSLVMNLMLPQGVQVIFFGRQAGCHVKLLEAHATRGGRSVTVVLEESGRRSFRTTECSSGFQVLEYLRDTQPLSVESNHHSRQVELEFSSPGLHLALNACAAASVAVALGIPLEIIRKTLIEFSPVGTRSKLEHVGDIQLINDTYNSNPMSVGSALRSLVSMDSNGRKIVFLGDMLELGTVSVRAHEDALLLCKSLQADFVGLVGPCFSEAALSLGLTTDSLITCRDAKELASLVGEILKPGDVVLVKGSRGMKMEIVAEAIKCGNLLS